MGIHGRFNNPDPDILHVKTVAEMLRVCFVSTKRLYLSIREKIKSKFLFVHQSGVYF